MAAIVRVKRRRVEEPADTLFMLCKRIKLEGADEGEEVKSVFKYAGTVNAKANEVATQFVQQAIRKEKLTNEYKRHKVDWDAKRKEERRRITSTGRCKIVAKKRALNFQGLQNDDDCDAPVDSEKQFLLYDVEKEKSRESATIPPTKRFCHETKSTAVDSEVTCNGTCMVRTKVTVPPDLARPSDEYVYDLYYMNSSKFDYRTLENVLAVELMREEFESGNGQDEYEEGYVDPDDDENDENNWRNDYPDEDPLYYETMDTEYFYGEDDRCMGDELNSNFDRCLQFEQRNDAEEEEEEERASDDLDFAEVLGTEVQQMDSMPTEKWKSLIDSYKLHLNSS